MTKGRRRALFLRGNALFALEIFAATAISATSASVAGRRAGPHSP
jgi:hypothetical protein